MTPFEPDSISRILVVVLALTASRSNFPWPAAAGFPTRFHSRSVQTDLRGNKKYEGVIPSRRLLESRRPDWVKTLASKACGESLQEGPQLAGTVAAGAAFGQRGTPLNGAPVCPAYLRPFLEASSSIPRPPPGLFLRG